MDLLILIFFISLIALVSILLDRRWQRRAVQRQQERVAKQVSPLPVANGQNSTLVDQIKAGWHKRMGWHSEPSADQPQLRTWLLANLADDPNTQQWIAGLTDVEFTALHQQLASFCSSLQIDLTWLGDQALAQDPTLQGAVQAAVLHYVQAQQQASVVQADLQAFKTYLALEQRPYSYEYQPLVQQLYTRLVKAGLTEPARPEALLATEKTRVEHMLRAIQHAAHRDRPAFYRILNTLSALHQNTAGSTAPAMAGHNPPATATT
jgi:hypothetical protein